MYIIVIGRDITERKSAEKEIKNKTDQLSTLYELSKKVASITSKEELLPWVAREAVKLLRADQCYFRIREGDYLVLASTTNKKKDLMLREKIKIDESLSGLAVKEKRPIISDDLFNDPRYILEHRKIMKKLGYKNFLGVPIMIGDEALGMINVKAREERKFDERDVALLSSFADIVAITLANINLFEKLNEEIVSRMNAEESIRASLEEKELLLQEIHHRVKNNMQIISSMLMLQEDYIKNKKFLDILRASQDRIRSMALVHEKIYERNELSNINIKDYILTLTQTLLNSYTAENDTVALEVDVEDIVLNIETTIPLALIVNELFTNSLKHAFSGRKDRKINISLHEIDKNSLELIIKDNGIGLPENFDIRKTKSFGLQIVSLLAEKQLHGKLDLTTDTGTEFKFVLKKTEYKKRLKLKN